MYRSPNDLVFVEEYVTWTTCEYRQQIDHGKAL